MGVVNDKNNFMQEIENQEAVLQNFKDEINKIKENNPSLFAVENVADLGLEEYQVWEKYKPLFKKMEIELSKLNLQQKNILHELLAEVNNLAEQISEKISITKNKNRLEFFAWMNNRLVGLKMNSQILLSKEADEETLQKSRDSLSKERNRLFF